MVNHVFSVTKSLVQTKNLLEKPVLLVTHTPHVRVLAPLQAAEFVL